MSRKFKSLLNLLTLTSDPAGSEGDVFFNTTEKALKIHNGITWVNIAKSSDPTPFYMHTHTYDGDVHTIDLQETITFTEINNENSSPVEQVPVIIGLDGGSPAATNNSVDFQNLTLLDGGTIVN
jgi:hypothetical protein